MGHVRTGFLPQTKKWNAIVEQLTLFDGDVSIVTSIANETLNAIKKKYESMPFDESVHKAILFLATLAFSAKQTDQVAYLRDKGYSVDDKLSLFSIISSAQKLINTENGSLEVNKIAKDSAMQAIVKYYEIHQNNQLSLWGDDSRSPIQAAGSGAAFCELARSFFSNFTDKQIKYYIERVAASSINDYDKLNKFSVALTAQSNAITDHAFETSKLVQSFAAGWFNKYSISNPPSESQITGFLRHSFEKMREEFRREAGGK
jgi:hypothetical protein